MNAITVFLNHFADHSAALVPVQSRFEALQPTPDATDFNDFGRFLAG